MARIIAGLVFTAVCFLGYRGNMISTDAMFIGMGIATVLLAFGADDIVKNDRDGKNGHT